jgi:hypothetical protein
VRESYSGLGRHIFRESEMTCSSECKYTHAHKLLDTGNIVEDAIYRRRIKGDPLRARAAANIN